LGDILVRVKRNLDAVDIEILKILTQNCREKLESIASKVGLSAPMVRKRIETMERLGIVKKCSAKIDLEMLDGVVTKALIIRHRGVERIADDLYRNKGVEKIYVSRADDTIIAIVRAINEQEVRGLVETLQKEIPNAEIIDIDLVMEREWVPEKPGIGIIYRCNFCGGVIIGSPHVVTINGVIRTFHGKECAEAYIQKRRLRLTT
jgi:Lrp/AsnC family leucine-responsive transcriptional regulator